MAVGRLHGGAMAQYKIVGVFLEGLLNSNKING